MEVTAINFMHLQRNVFCIICVYVLCM